MAEASSAIWTIVAVVIGAFVTLIGALIILYLRAIKHDLCKFNGRISVQEKDAKKLQVNFSACKVDCERNFVPKEAFLRETGFTRRSLENLNSGVSRLEGKLTIVDQLPKICGDISREIVKEMKNGDLNGRH